MANLSNQELNAIFNQLWPKILSNVKKILRNSEDAKDVTQEVLLKIFENRLYQDKSKIKGGYLYKLVKNSAIDFIRKKKRLPIEPFNDRVRENLGVPIKFEVSKTIEDLVDSLLIKGFITKSQYEVLKLSMAGYEPEEIAMKLGTSEGAVRRSSQRARKKIKEQQNTRSSE